MALRDRLAALEQRVAGGGILVVVIKGGMPRGEDPMVATAGELRWARDPGECEGEFKARVRKAAADAGQQRVVIGGLPA